MGGSQGPIALEVTEWMKGFVGLGARDYDDGFIAGIDAGGRFEHEMLIVIEDIERFAADPRHPARLRGTITCPALGGTVEVKAGLFEMFVDAAKPGLKYMKYRMPYQDAQGRVRTVFGHKTIHDDRSLDLWSDTTTLFVKVAEGEPAREEDVVAPVAAGTIHIEKLDLIRSIRSFRTPGASVADAAQARATFARFFFGKLWEVYGPRV